MAITQECCEQYWTSPGGNTQQGINYTATCLPSRKLSKLDEPDMYALKQISWLKCAKKWKPHDLNKNVDNKQNIYWVDDDEKVDGNRLDIKTVQLEKLEENRKIENGIINNNKYKNSNHQLEHKAMSCKVRHGWKNLKRKYN